MLAPSISYSITIRPELPAGGSVTGDLARAAEKAGGELTTLDVSASGHDRLRVDVTCEARDTGHAGSIVAVLSHLPGVTVHKGSRGSPTSMRGRSALTRRTPTRSFAPFS